MSIQIRADGILDPDGKYPNPLTGQPYSKRYKILSTTQPGSTKKGWRELSCWKSRMKILAKIHKSSILLLKIPPGTGKTVIIPKLLLHYFGYQKRVICTVPKQVAASEAANFAANCLDVPIYHPDEKGGDSKILTNYKMVGYKYQGTLTKFYEPQKTILLFTTDGSVEAMILGGDINLANYGGIIIDEAHERSVTIDIIIALVMDIIPRRPDFKIIIMSATIDMQFFEDYFIRINQGKNYSVFDLPNEPSTAKLDYINSPPKNNVSTKLEEVVYKKLEEIILDSHLPNGDILAFVTSNTDIDKIKQLLNRNMSKFPVNNKPYFIGFSSNISDDDKKIATDKGSLKTIPISKDAPQGYSRKVIIGTNAVESSLTFGDPLVYVIESGFAFEVKYNAKNYCIDTGKVLVSQASITQRCGRTGRTNDGTCIQLYSKEQFKKLPEWTEPKIRTEDFTPTLLSIITLPNNGNLQKALEFINKKMIEPVKNYKDFIIRGYENLLNMGIIDTSGNLTSLGYVCSRFSIFDLKIVKMVIGGYYLGCLDMCVMLGAIISSIDNFDDVFYKPPDMIKNPKLQQQYDNNVKRFVDKTGDHITLLKIFFDFYMNPNKSKYTTENGLNFKNLSKIQSAYSDLLKMVTSNAQLIKNLNLFSVPPEVLVFGGGKRKHEHKIDSINNNVNINNNGNSDNIDNISNNINNMFGGDDGDGDDESDNESDNESDESDDIISDASDESDDIDNIISRTEREVENGNYNDSDDSGDSDDSDSENSNKSNDSDSETKNINMSKNIKEKGKELELGNNFTVHNNNKKKEDDYFNSIYGGYNKGSVQYNENDINLSNKNIGKYRKLSIKNYKGNKSKKLYTKHKEEKRQVMSGGNHDKVVERRLKIMNLVELGNLQPRVMKPPIHPPERVLAALYYGFSINRACYSGEGKNYFVKSSPLKGSIAKSSFDYSNKTPDFVIYNKFTVSKGVGKTDSKLSLVSEIGSKEFGQFLNLIDIKKKLD
jgi:HrpA-like RNA helicase